MSYLLNVLHDMLPLIGVILLIIGIKYSRMNYIVAALWLSLIALMLHYQTAGGEILGSYFDYKNSAIYSLNLVVLVITLLYLFIKLPLLQGKRTRYVTGFVSACMIVGSLVLLTNLWINANFIENRKLGTPIMQVALFNHAEYCPYRYIFYRVGRDGKVGYMCPDYYGVFPSIGQLDTPPSFISNLLAQHHATK